MTRLPAISVVIALAPDPEGADECLGALAPQAGAADQIIAVAAFPPNPGLVRRHPTVQWLAGPGGSLIPRLWGQGIAAATGEIVAITTGHFRPAADWIDQIRGAFDRVAADAIGGPVEPPRGGGPAAWANFFLRYSVLFRRKREEPVDDVAGDNAAYRREALARHAASFADGFWEIDFHRRLLAEGRRIFFIPRMRVELQPVFRSGAFCAQRFRHGRHFGRDRSRAKSGAIRLARFAASPLVPAVMVTRIACRLSARPGYLPAFLGSLPHLALFTSAWAAGEAVGCLEGPATA